MSNPLRCFGVLSCLFLGVTPAFAHGVVGARFFPATLSTDDPFAADELALPTISVFKPDGGPRETDTDMEWSKTIVRGFAISFGGEYVDTSASKGWNNLEIAPVVELARIPDREFIMSAALGVEIGGSGSKAVADPFSTYTPALLFGKGFGDLPDGAAFLRPFAVTGSVGYAIPGTHTEARSVEWGGALEYSLAYLNTNVRDLHLGKFVSQLTPLVEFSLSSPSHGGTTGTINPGILWSGQYIQLGIEASIPVNSATGHSVGAVAQLHFYVDDIFPHSLGAPLFGGNP